MTSKLIVQINEVLIRDYSLIEDEGLNALVAGADNLGITGLALSYEDDEEENEGKSTIIIAAPDLPSILKFLHFIDLPVEIFM